MAFPDVSLSMPLPSSPIRKMWRRTSRSLSKMIESAPAQAAFARVVSTTDGISCSPFRSRYVGWFPSLLSTMNRILPTPGSDTIVPRALGDGDVAIAGLDDDDAATVGAWTAGKLGALAVAHAAATNMLMPHKGPAARCRVGRSTCRHPDGAPVMAQPVAKRPANPRCRRH